MKRKSPFVLLMVILLHSCSQELNKKITLDLVEQVEEGLIPTAVYIQGDSTWSIEERMLHYGIPGVSIAVIYDGEMAWAKGYGVVDKNSKAPVTQQTRFQTISKPLAAYGALRMVEQHKLSLDEDVNNYLKSWKLPENEFTREKKVTLRHLLNHSAGINIHGFGGYGPDEEIPTLIEVLKGTTPANSNPVIVDKAIGESNWFSAGGYAILQQLMMDIEDKRFEEIMDEQVLGPLEMDHSSFDQPLTPEQLKMAATGYLSDGGKVAGGSNTYPELASEGLWSTATDLSKFVINLQQTLKNNSNKALSKGMTDLMLTPFVEDFWGLGMYTSNRGDDVYFGQGQWNEGFFSHVIAHKEKGYGLVMLTNTTHPPFFWELARSVARAYDWDSYLPVHEKFAIETAYANEVTGSYWSGEAWVEISQLEQQLFIKYKTEQAEELIKISDSLYVSRNSSRFIQFRPTPRKESIDLLFIDRYEGKTASTFSKINDDPYTVAYSEMETNDVHIYLGDLASKATANNINEKGGYMAWSPDGKQLAFYAKYDDRKTWSIHTMNVDGTNRQRLTNAKFRWDSAPDWSPDGSKIIFAREYKDPEGVWHPEIWIMNADGTEQTQIEALRGSNPYFTEDSRIVYSSEYADKNSEISIADIDGGNIIHLTDNDAKEWHPEVSPDGQQIAFMSDRDGQFEIYVMDIDGSNQKRLTYNEEDNWYPSWSPDGSKIIFSSVIERNKEKHIYVMNKDGSSINKIIDNSGYAVFRR